jgi:acetyl esterase
MQDPRTVPGIDPEMAEAMLKSRDLVPEGRLDVTTAPIADVRTQYFGERTYWNEDGPEMYRTKDISIDGPHGPIPVRFYYPNDAENLPLVLYFHGGGFIYGGIPSHDKVCRWMAGRSGVAFASVDYRLAPEHKFPTPLDEALAVLDYVTASADALNIDSSRIGMGGDSAGASITMGTALSLKEAGRTDALKFMLLFYGSYGLGYDCESSLKYNDVLFGLSEERRRFYRSSYIANESDHEDPRLKHLAADVSGLPPAFLGAAEMDPLCDNTPPLSERLTAAGVVNDVTIYPGVLHGFIHLTRMVGAARTALNDAGNATRAALGK